MIISEAMGKPATSVSCHVPVQIRFIAVCKSPNSGLPVQLVLPPERPQPLTQVC
jgi:hypothetical protein